MAEIGVIISMQSKAPQSHHKGKYPKSQPAHFAYFFYYDDAKIVQAEYKTK